MRPQVKVRVHPGRKEAIGSGLHRAQPPPYERAVGHRASPNARVKEHPVKREGLMGGHANDIEARRDQAMEVAPGGAELETLVGIEQTVHEDERVVSARFQHIEAAAAIQDPVTLRQQRAGIGDVMEDIADQHLIKAARREGKLGSVRNQEATLRDRPSSEGYSLRRHIDPDGSRGSSEVAERRPMSAADVEDPSSKR